MSRPLSPAVSTLWLLASLWLTLGGVSGCLLDSSECELGKYHCAGLEVQYCELPCAEPGCGNRWTNKASCSVSCVEPHDGEAMCAISPDRDERCGSAGFCRETVLVQCAKGFPVSESDCAEGGRQCVEPEGGLPFCALSQQMDERCPQRAASAADAFDQACDGETLLACRGGFLVSTQACGAACVSPEAQGSFCAVSGEPDPRCDPPNPMLAAFCVDDVLARCQSGYAVAVEDCALKRLSCGSSPADGTAGCL